MKKGKVVVTILLVIVIGVLMFIVGQYASGKMDYNMFKESETITKSKNSDDNQVLDEITKVYKNAFENIQKVKENDGMIDSTYNNNETIYTINKEIASTLNISERTVKNHVSNIFKKIEVSDRTQAAVFAIKNGIITIK